MRILIILLLLTTSKVSTALGVYNGESGKLHRDFQNGEFLNNIGDWLGYLKNRIHERLFGQQTTTTTKPSPLLTEILNLDKFQFQKRLRNREWFLLDLTNLTFDPNHDWGFRVGSWYFIRKGLENLNGFKNDFEESAVPQSQSTTQSEDSIEINTKKPFETTNDLATTTESSTISIPIQSEIPSMTQQISTTTMQNTVQSYSSESSTLTTFKWVGDSETNEDFAHKGSVEVLMG